MSKKSKLAFITLSCVFVILLICFISNRKNEQEENKANYLRATVLTVSNDSITVRDGYNLIYTFDSVNDFMCFVLISLYLDLFFGFPFFKFNGFFLIQKSSKSFVVFEGS